MRADGMHTVAGRARIRADSPSRHTLVTLIPTSNPRCGKMRSGWTAGAMRSMTCMR